MTDQTQTWNGAAGNAWVDAQATIDEAYRPFEELLLGAARGSRVLDVGCGSGGTTVAVARRVEHCVGIDISAAMIAAAEARAERAGVRASFIQANAQDHAFGPGAFDMIISRFGVMFFDDSVKAFTNLRRAAADGELRAIVWRDIAENPFMTTAEQAAAPILPNIPARDPRAPGQFAFADRDKVHGILADSGWTGIDIQPVDMTCTFPESALVGYFTRLGPVGLVLPEADESTRARVIETVRPAFDPFVHGGEVRFTAACWMLSAR